MKTPMKISVRSRVKEREEMAAILFDASRMHCRIHLGSVPYPIRIKGKEKSLHAYVWYNYCDIDMPGMSEDLTEFKNKLFHYTLGATAKNPYSDIIQRHTKPAIIKIIQSLEVSVKKLYSSCQFKLLEADDKHIARVAMFTDRLFIIDFDVQ